MKASPAADGSMAWTGKIADDDAHVLRVLWKAGCVFHVRTALAQNKVWTESARNGVYSLTSL